MATKDVRALAGDERGFTLIETILSLSILVVMIGLVLSALRLGQRSMEKGEEAMNDAAVRRFIVTRLSSDVASMFPYSRSEGSTKDYLFRGNEQELGFVTTRYAGYSGAPWGGATYVLYSRGDSGAVVTERTVPFAMARGGGDGRSFDLGPGISDMGFRYLGDGGWVKEWDVAEKKSLPRAVRAVFLFREDDPPLVVTVPVRASYDLGDEKAGKGGAGGANGSHA